MEFIQSFLHSNQVMPWKVIVFAGLLSFVLSQIIALVYEKTYQGMSYSRSLVQALALVGVLASSLMMTIGDNLARGLGIAGIFAVVRFRTNLRDPRDIIFVFASISVGISCGIQGFGVAISTTLIFCFAALYLHYVPLGSRLYFDGMLRFYMKPDLALSEDIQNIMSQLCRTHQLITLRELSQGKQFEYAYQVKLWKAKDKELLLHTIQSLEGVENVSLYLQDSTVEL